ncbi:hypothetical protein WISP_115838 [Willisornis vidua]|uniref:Uncharacterized protein n=1 Tax=Willisornis vidua TaxID=1566151 RepID=A0ABQ9CU79_9PASS|nr:hypothetical protein WISP_115838 [Willisornis vidua]
MKYMELCLEMDEELIKRLWTRIIGMAGTEELGLMRRDAVLDLVLNDRVGLVGNVKLNSILGFNDRETTEFKIFRTARSMFRDLTTLEFRKVNFGLLKDLLGRDLVCS